MSKKKRIQDAVDLFEDFTGDDPKSIETYIVDIPEEAMEIGPLDGILYTAIRDGKEEKYIHTFKESARPLLAVSSDGKQLILVGGSYQFTEKGIEDG